MLRPAKKMISLGVPSSNRLAQGTEITTEVRAIKRRDVLDSGDDVGIDEVDDEG